METIGKIRRRRLVQGESISAIARELKLSRNTVKKALRAEGETFEYRRASQPQPKLGPYLPLLDQWLQAEAKLRVRERRTAQRLYEALQLEGYTGAVDGVRRYVRRVSARQRLAEAFIPQRFAPGEAYQFDWSHEHVELGGEPHVVKVAHLRLCYSRAFLVSAYPRETQDVNRRRGLTRARRPTRTSRTSGNHLFRLWVSVNCLATIGRLSEQICGQPWMPVHNRHARSAPTL